MCLLARTRRQHTRVIARGSGWRETSRDLLRTSDLDVELGGGMDSKGTRLTALASVLGTLTALLALCFAIIRRGFDGSLPTGAKYCLLAIVGLFTLTVVVGLLAYRQRKGSSEVS